MKIFLDSYQSYFNNLQIRGADEVARLSPFQTKYVDSHIQIAEAKNSDGPRGPVVDLILKPNGPVDKSHFYKPIFPPRIAQELDGSYDSEVTHTEQMNLHSLQLSLLGILSGELPVDPAFRDILLNRAAALLFGGASIAHFVVDSNHGKGDCGIYTGGQKYVDAGKLSHYVLTPKSFYNILANRGIPTVDVHDFVHHAAQFRTWPNFYIPLYNIAAIVNDLLTSKDIDECTMLYRIKLLISFISFATAEYSVVTDGNPQNNYSFGCLLYQYPRKSPMSKIDFTTERVTAREFTNWNSARALMSLQRRVLEARYQFGDSINWLEQLGYNLPEKYYPTLNEFGRTIREPLAHLDRTDLNIDSLRFPDGPFDLFEHAITLLASELHSIQLEQLIPPQKLNEINTWLMVMNSSFGTH